MAEGGSNALRTVLAYVGIEYDDKGFKEAEKGITSLKGAFLGVGAVIGAVKAALVGATLEAVESANAARLQATRLGITTQQYQELGAAAQVAEVDQGSLTQAMVHLSRSAYEAATKGGQAAVTFGKLGVSLHDASGQLKAPNVLLGEVGDKLKNLHNATERTALTMQIFGRGGAAIAPLLAEGGAKIAITEAAHRFGAVMSDDFIEKSKEFTERMNMLKLAGIGLRNAIAERMLPGINKIVSSILEWYKANQVLVTSGILKFIETFTGGIEGASTLMGKFVGFIVDGYEALYRFSPLVAAVTGGLLLFGLVAASPIVGLLALAAVILLVLDDYDRFEKGQASVIGSVIASWDKWIDKLKDSHPYIAKTMELVEKLAHAFSYLRSGKLGADVFDATESVGNALSEQTAKKFGIADQGQGGSQLRSGIQQAASTLTAGLIPAPYAPSITQAITVNAAAGQSAEDVAGEVVKQSKEASDEHYRYAKAALTPVGAAQ